MTEPLVTALVSSYKAERFMRGCLESLAQQTLGDRLEILVCDSNSPEDEGGIVREFQDRHPNIHYLRTGYREDTSEAFNRLIGMAKGKYLTTANADDRYRSDALDLMARALEEHPEFGIVYPDSLITTEAGESFENTSARLRFDWPDYSPTAGLSCCLFGPQPLWRRDVHETLGLFDIQHKRANDQDLFLRIARDFGAVHLRETLGLFLRRPDSNSGIDNNRETIEDVMAVLRKHRSTTSLDVIFPGLQHDPGDTWARAAALVEMGKLCALGPYNDYTLALDFFSRAVDPDLWGPMVPPALQAVVANNAACVFACTGSWDQARRSLALALALAQNQSEVLPEISANAMVIQAQPGDGHPLRPGDLQFAEIPHALIEESRKVRGLELDPAGRLRWSEYRSQQPWDVFEGPNGVPVETATEPETAEILPHLSCLPALGRLEDRQLEIDQPEFRLPTIPSGGSPKHILIVMYGWADSGGGTMLPRQVARALASRGHRVTVFYAMAQERPELPPYSLIREDREGVTLYGMANRPALFRDLESPEREIDDPRIRKDFAGLLDREEPDFVHFYNLHNLGLSLPQVCKDRGIPTAFSSNNYWPICPRLYLFDTDLSRCVGAGEKGADCSQCLAQDSKDEAHAARALASRKMLNEAIDVHLAVSTRVREIYIHNGADPKKIQVLQQQPESLDHIWEAVGRHRAIEASLDRPLRVGYIGSIMPHKGVQVLVAGLGALAKVCAEGKIEGSVDGILHGDASLEFARYLENMDKADSFRFGGMYSLDELPQKLSELDLVVVPSIWEDCAPYVVAEALAARIPVIGSRIGGIPDFIEDGVTGFLFEPGNAAELARLLARFLTDPSLLGRLQTSIREPRGFQAYLDDLEAIYEFTGPQSSVELAGSTPSHSHI